MNGDRRRRLALAVSVTALFAIALRLAWLGDDAYITLRCVENWVRGNGLRWNPGDRVMTYTHPLWMLVLAVGRWCSGEVYFTTIALSLATSMLAVVLLLKRATTTAALAAVALVLAGTRAFVEYSTSGLETPLVYLLLVLFAGVVGSEGDRVQRFRRLVLVAALLATTRMDLAILCAPAVLASLRGVGVGAALRAGALAALPFVGWLLFAVIYYGSPLPVTAHAKAFGVGIPAGEMVAQGLQYAAFAVFDDPVLLPTVLVGLVIGLAQRTTRWLALGAVLYVGYVMKVGGDFMAGRFFLPPFVVAVALLATWLSARSWRVPVVVMLAVLVLTAMRGVPPWLCSPASDVPPADLDRVIEAQHGIGDERRIYYPQLGLWSPTRKIPAFGALHAEVRPEGGGRWILLNGAVGVAGFQAGAVGHVLDPLLCDPLIARLPARDAARWRIGHVLRRIPEGYYETLASGENQLLHPGLHAFHDALRAATQAPVFAAERWSLLRRLAMGEFDAGLRDFVAGDYRRPPRVPVDATTLPPPLPLGAFWFDEPMVRLVYDGGLAVTWPTPQRAGTLRVQTMGLCDFRFRFVRSGVVRGDAKSVPMPPPANITVLRTVAGLREELVAVPAGVGTFDTLWIDAVGNAMTHTSPGPPAVGAITLVP